MIALRDLTAADRPAIAALLASVGNLTASEQDIALELIDEGLRSAAGGEADPTRYRFFVATDEADPAVLGYLCWGRTPMTARTVDLYWIVVDKKTQGRGVGRALLAGLQATMAREGLRTIRVETASQEAYDGTIAFYEKTGFALSGRIADFYDDDDDLLVFTKRID